jgi:precorrin-2 dehydrogenase/sirohydrochlorin ferrochelatase
MSDYFPAFLDLRDRPCLVVGGGPVGERKVGDLLRCGARVTVVSPRLTPDLATLAAAGRIAHRPRPFRRADVRGAALVIAATGVPAVDAAVAAEARRRRALVNVVDRPAECDFILPSVLRRGGLQIAVSTGGRSPALAREIRKRLERVIGPEYADLVERVGRERKRARTLAVGTRDRLAAGERVVADALAAVGAARAPFIESA